jgi:tRNA threonylcarbamoyladenosine biosynthesis protein TsaB
MALIDFALQSAKLALEDVDGFVVTRGPGSFTGLRIGISTIKGLVLATGKPLISVSCLEALAYQIPFQRQLICPMLDARRNEVYTAQYRWQAERLVQCQKEAVLPPAEAIKTLRAPCIFIGSGAILYQGIIRDTLNDGACFVQPWQHLLRGATIAHVGLDKMNQRQFDDVNTMRPLYLRKSDAQIHLEQRL